MRERKEREGREEHVQTEIQSQHSQLVEAQFFLRTLQQGQRCP